MPTPFAVDASKTAVESDTYALEFDTSSGLLHSITNKHSGATTPLSVTPRPC